METKKFNILMEFQKKLEEKEIRIIRDKDGVYKNKYVSYEELWDKIRPVMKELGLTTYSIVNMDKIITYMLLDGEVIMQSDFPLFEQSPQKIGAVITYARRYNLCAMLNIIADEDDDTQKTVASTKKEEPKKENQQYGDNKKRMKELLVKAGKATKAEAEAFIKEFTGNVRNMEHYTEEEAKEDLIVFYSKKPTEGPK